MVTVTAIHCGECDNNCDLHRAIEKFLMIMSHLIR